MPIKDSPNNNVDSPRRIGRGLKYIFTSAMIFLASCNGNIFPNQRITETATSPAPTEVPTKPATPTLLPTNGPLKSPLPTPTSRPAPTEANTPKLADTKDVATLAPVTVTPIVDYRATSVVLSEDLVKEKAKVKKLEEDLNAEKEIARLNSIDPTYIEERLELVINLCTYCYQELIITNGITSTGNETVTFNLGTNTNLNIDMSGFTKTYTTEMGSVFMVDDRMVSQFESFIMLKYIPELLNKQNKNILEQRIADRVTKNMNEGRKLLASLVFAIREIDKILGLEVFIPNDGCVILPAKASGTPTPTGTTPPTATGTPTPTRIATGTRPPEPSSTPRKDEPTTVPTRRIEPTNTPPQATATNMPEPTSRIDPTSVPTRIIP